MKLISLVLVTSVGLLVACGGSNNPGAPRVDAKPGDALAPGSGGSSVNDGAPPTGGSVGTGGTPSTGGHSSGDASAAGGASGLDGSFVTGGRTAPIDATTAGDVQGHGGSFDSAGMTGIDSKMTGGTAGAGGISGAGGTGGTGVIDGGLDATTTKDAPTVDDARGTADADGATGGSDAGGLNCSPCSAPLTCRGGGVDDTCGYTSTPPTGKVCSPGGWCFVTPSPQGNTLNSVFSLSGTDIWAAGAAATVMHWDGSAWSGVAGLVESTVSGVAGNSAAFYSVWASGPGDVWLAGTTGTAPLLVRGDGTHWNVVTVPTSGKYLKRFQGIWGTGPDDVWIGGWLNGAVYHWDGASWTRTVYAEDGTTMVEYVTGVAKNDLFIGTNGTIARFNGSSFTDQGITNIYGVWATPGAGVWASEDGVGKLWHLVGSTWISYQIPNGYDVTALWGDSSSSLWVAGHYRVTVTTPALWRFDGKWTMISQAGSAGALSISGPTNQSDAIAVSSVGQIDLLTGTTAVENAYAAGATYDVQGTSSSDVWLAGGPDFRATHFDGAGFTDYRMGGTGSYTAVGVSPGGDIWTATSNVSYKFDGTRFVSQTGTTGVTINSFWAPQNDSIWATTGTSAVYLWGGSSWQTVMHALVGSSVALRAVWGTSPSNVWLVGDSGITQRYDGKNWTPYTTPDTTGDLFGVWGWDATHALATSSKGVVYSWDGQQWTQSYSLAGGLGRIHGCSQNDIWAVRTDASRVQHYDGASWSESATGLAVPGAAIWCASPGDAWMVGSISSSGRGGAVLRRQ